MAMQRINKLRAKAPPPAPSAEDNARAIIEECREVMALINDHKLIDDEKNGLRPADDVGDEYWSIMNARDYFLCVTLPWWQRQTGVEQQAEPNAKRPSCHDTYQLAFEIASALETYIKRTK